MELKGINVFSGQAIRIEVEQEAIAGIERIPGEKGLPYLMAQLLHHGTPAIDQS